MSAPNDVGQGFTAVGIALATLFLTPVAYLILARLTRPAAEEEERLSKELSAGQRGPAVEPAE